MNLDASAGARHAVRLVNLVQLGSNPSEVTVGEWLENVF